MLLIGLTGYARSGKDTVAQRLCAKNGFKQFAFADPIREALFKLNPIVNGGVRLQDIMKTYSWDDAKDEYPEIRHLLQRLGAEVGREMFGPNFWVRQIEHRIKHSNAERVVISDVRYPNEAQMIKDNGGQIWRVRRTGFYPINNHGSESAMDKWKADQEFANTGSIADLHALIQTRMLQYV